MGNTIARSVSKKVGRRMAVPLGTLLNQNYVPADDADLLLKFDSRAGNVLTDSLTAETATILVEEFKSNGTNSLNGNKTRVVEHFFDGNDHTVYARIKQHTAIPGSGTQSIMKLGGTATALLRGIFIKSNNGIFRYDMSDGATTYEKNQGINCNTSVLPLEYVDLLITIDGTGKSISFTYYNPAGAALGTGTATQSLAAFNFNTNDNASAFVFDSPYFIITNFKKFSGIKTRANCIDNSYVTGLALHYPHLIGLMNTVEDANHLFSISAINSTFITYINCNSYGLDYGWDNYQQGLIDVDNTAWNRYCCRKTDGTQIKPDVTGVGNAWNAFRVIGERAGGTLCNLFPGKIRFTNAFFDRSNATIWNDSARLGYYDAANVKDFHISELNQRTLASWLNDGYRGRLYVNFNTNSIEKLDRDFLAEILLTTTDRKGNDNKAILTYTGDIIAAVLSGTAVIFDAQNYVKLGILKTTIPMLSFVIDDGYLDAYTGWRGFFATNNIKPLSGLHSNQVGQVIDGNDSMTWANIHTLVSEGWLMGNHNTEDSATDYSDVTMQATLEALLIEGKADIEAQGIDCDWYVGNRHSSNNAAIEYFAKKLGYKGHCTWNVYGEGGVIGANPAAINLFRLRRLNCDLDPPVGWDLDKASALTEIQNVKDELDLCLSENRWAIIMLHNPSANLYTNLQTIIDYAGTIGVTNVSLDEALSNIKYL
jgi:hypothetical protein